MISFLFLSSSENKGDEVRKKAQLPSCHALNVRNKGFKITLSHKWMLTLHTLKDSLTT